MTSWLRSWMICWLRPRRRVRPDERLRPRRRVPSTQRARSSRSRWANGSAGAVARRRSVKTARDKR
eukprot:6656777-Pyramimonas_sp.AAC.1